MLRLPGAKFVRQRQLERTRHSGRLVFVLSTGRVGTDTLTQVLNQSVEINAFHEPEPRFLAETKSAYQTPPSNRRETLDLAAFYHHARMFEFPAATTYRTCLRRGLVFAETSNRLTYFAPSLAEYFPLAQFIHLHREPANVVRSAMRRRFYAGHGWDAYRIEPRSSDPFASAWEAWTPFEKCCWYWRAINEFALNFNDSLDGSRTFNLPSADLFDGNGDVLRRLFEWIGVSPPDDDSLQQIVDVPHNAQERGDFPKWPKWTREQKSQMLRIVQPVSSRLGYSYDDAVVDA
jgi:hypothetical protein